VAGVVPPEPRVVGVPEAGPEVVPLPSADFGTSIAAGGDRVEEDCANEGERPKAVRVAAVTSPSSLSLTMTFLLSQMLSEQTTRHGRSEMRSCACGLSIKLGARPRAGEGERQRRIPENARSKFWHEEMGLAGDRVVSRQRRSRKVRPMADDSAKLVPKDMSRVNLTEDDEVRYWSRALSVSVEQLRMLTRRHGDSADAIRRAIRR
jgi:hypothetical protein